MTWAESADTPSGVAGAGLGLRRGMMSALERHENLVREQVDFMEVAPENWIGVGGRFGRRFRVFRERFPFVCHGLSLSLGSPSELDIDFLYDVKAFLDEYEIDCYTEHLSACSDTGHLYDLMPIPFTEEAVRYVAARIRRTADVLERDIAVEHVSYYANPTKAALGGTDARREMTELEFINAVVEEADCRLLLDVNNIFVNSINHGYDPMQFLAGLLGERVAYIHVAGHYEEAPDIRIDTHGAAIIDPVWQLLEEAYRLYGPLPTLLERDFNFPPLAELLEEVGCIRSLQRGTKQRGTKQRGTKKQHQNTAV